MISMRCAGANQLNKAASILPGSNPDMLDHLQVGLGKQLRENGSCETTTRAVFFSLPLSKSGVQPGRSSGLLMSGRYFSMKHVLERVFREHGVFDHFSLPESEFAFAFELAGNRVSMNSKQLCHGINADTSLCHQRFKVVVHVGPPF